MNIIELLPQKVYPFSLTPNIRYSPDTITVSHYRQIPNLPIDMLPTGTPYLTIFRQYLLGKSNQVIHSCFFLFLQHNKYSALRLGLDSKHVILNGLISVIGAFS